MIKLLFLLLEVLLVGGVLIFTYAQLIRPLVRKTPVFPMFRKRPSTERQIEGVNEKIEDKELEHELKERQRRLDSE